MMAISTTGLRFFTVYGPWGRPDMAPMLFADAILNDRAIKVFNHGNMSRDFTYVADIVDGIIKVIDNPAKANKTFDASNPNPSISSTDDLKLIVTRISEIPSSKLEPFFIGICSNFFGFIIDFA